MCSPSLVTLGLQVGGGTMSAANAQANAEQNANYYNYLGEMDRIQATTLELNAARQVKYTQDNAAAQTKQVVNLSNETKGSQIVGMNANGVGAGSASAEDILSDTFKKTELDKLAIKYNADVASYETTESARAGAFGLRSRADAYDTAATNSRSAGKMNFWSSILGTAAMAGTSYLNLNYGTSGGSSKGGK